MQKTKNHYIKYTRAELENYTKLNESCVKKVNCIEPVRFSPTIYVDFQAAVLRILSRKIGRFDAKLNGVVLDYRNTKIMSSQSAIRQDSPFSLINVETNFYVFSPRKGAIVTGAVKHINRLSMETVISVVIYRVFNVKVTVKGIIKQELERNQEIRIRVKDFHFENVIPFIEGEVVDTGVVFTGTKKLFDDVPDSGISESSVTSDVNGDRLEAGPSGIKIKQERESSDDSSESSHSSQKKVGRKRKNSDETSMAPKSKRIKSEPVSSDDEPASPKAKIHRNDSSCQKNQHKVSLKKERKQLTQPSSPVQIKQEPIENFSDSTPRKDKKSKKKKKRRADDEDDFESSLRILLEAQIMK